MGYRRSTPKDYALDPAMGEGNLARPGGDDRPRAVRRQEAAKSGRSTVTRYLLRQIFDQIGRRSATTTLRVEFADGSVLDTGSGGTADVAIRFRNTRGERHTLIYFYHGLFESYIGGDVDLDGDWPVARLARLGHELGMAPSSFWRRLLANPLTGLRQLAQERQQNNTDRERSMRNADYHYALHPALFEHMLADTVGYSEGVWTPATTTLTQAKVNNYEYVCQKLRLQPGLKVIEVGSGWGYMPIYMVKRYGVEVTVYNPVRRQNDYMRARFERHGVADRIRLVEGDHRDIMAEAGGFDRFVSIGVHEHAGYARAQYRLWARSIATTLKDGGLGVVSTTSLMNRQMTNLLTLEFIFPGGHLPSLPDTLAAFDAAGLMLVEVENLWPHYRRTVEQWRKNVNADWPEIAAADPAVFTESFRRKWTMYLEATYEVFRDSLDLSHIVFTKGRDGAYYPWQVAGELTPAFVGGDDEPECYR